MITVDQINQSLNQKVNEADYAANSGGYMDQPLFYTVVTKSLIAIVFILFLFVRKYIEYNERETDE